MLQNTFFYLNSFLEHLQLHIRHFWQHNFVGYWFVLHRNGQIGFRLEDRSVWDPAGAPVHLVHDCDDVLRAGGGSGLPGDGAPVELLRGALLQHHHSLHRGTGRLRAWI